MRRVSQIIVACAVAILFITSCERDMNLDLKTVVVKENPKVYPDPTSVEISGRYEFPSILKGIDLYVSKHEDLYNAKLYPAKVTDHDFSVTIDELKGGTTYYYCYEFDNGMDKVRSSEVSSFETAPYTDAIVETDSVTSIKAKTAVCYGSILSAGGYEIVKCGVCWSTNDSPSLNHHKDTMPDINGHFSVKLTDLKPGRDYNAWTYLYTSNDPYHPVYGEPKSFTTKDGKPTVQIKEKEVGIESTVIKYVIWTDFNLPISEYGICWSRTSTGTIPTPDNCEGKQSGVGGFNEQGFTAEMTGLTAGEEYHVRAYATNEVGTYYNDDDNWVFPTHTGKPAFNGFKVIRIKDTNAVILGYVTDGGDPSITIGEWFFIWSTNNSELNISNSEGRIWPSDWGQTNMSGLESGQDYYVRPYVEYNDNRHEYGATMHFKTTKKGGLTGAFTINDNGDQVCFSQGNLQYIGSAATPYWKLAENQWESFGTYSYQNSSSQNVDRDLFGWGTSGNNHNDACYQPWSVNHTNTKYWAYGKYYANLTYNGQNDADWGHNRITINIYGNTIHDDEGWRTLTDEEWIELIRNCKQVGHYAPGTIETHRGHILLPDDWSLPEGSSFDKDAVKWETNTYTETEWDDMEAAGAVFLPAAGFRYKGSGAEATDVGHWNQVGYYWSSTSYDQGSSWRRVFHETSSSHETAERYNGCSVRLVHDL